MKKLIIQFTLLIPAFAFSQVAKKVVVEHFTNTLCSICASKNPGLYTNLGNNPSVMHISYHPSSPYAACVFNNHNITQNDARTNFYGIYGGTPRLVIQGVTLSASTNFASSTLFQPFMGQQSPVSIRVTQTNFGIDSVSTRIVIKNEAAHTLSNLLLFAALTEDTIFYSAPNGEQMHGDVFRKSLTAITGNAITITGNAGDSSIFNYTTTQHMAWNLQRIFTTVILQDATTKAVIQAENNKGNVNTTSGLNETIEKTLTVFPNPANDVVNITLPYNGYKQYSVYDTAGKKVLESIFFGTSIQIEVANLSHGLYFVIINAEGNMPLFRAKIIVTD